MKSQMRMADRDSLKPHPESHLVPEMRPDEWREFLLDISMRGVKVPLEVEGDGTIVDGHHRWKAAQPEQLNIIKLPITDAILGHDSSTEYMLKAAVLRRHLTDDQRATMASMWKARHQHTPGPGRGHIGEKTSPPRGGEVSDHPTSEKACRLFNITRKPIDNATFLMNRDTEKFEAVHRGEMRLTEAVRLVRHERRIEQGPIDFPNGKYSVIYADPPWEYRFAMSDRGDPTMHYPVMSIESLCKIQPPIADDAILFLWVPNPQLAEGLALIEAWGFEYKTNFVWVKDRIGTGYYVRGQHELLLIGKRGSMPTPLPSDRPASVIFAKRTNHSAKPAIVYELIEKMFPNHRNRIELFARTSRTDWTSWGDELKG